MNKFRIPTSTGPVVGKHHRLSSSSSHRRSDSLASVGSVISVTSDITKSAFFQGVSESGHVQFFLPVDNIRLIMDDNLHSGILCQNVEDDKSFEAYEQQLAPGSSYASNPDLFHYGLSMGAGVVNGNVAAHPIREDHSHIHPLQRPPAGPKQHPLTSNRTDPGPSHSSYCQCHCNCTFCNSCHAKTSKLPDSTYLLTVEHDLYKRVLSEIADSRSTPCGLFFCGHHEDVNRPSILIAGGIVTVVMIALFVATEAYAGG